MEKTIKQDHCHSHMHDGQNNILSELMCHLPYAIFSVAFSLAILTFVSFFTHGSSSPLILSGYDMLFHSFHFLHIIFAATGAMITFFRFSKDVTRGVIASAVSTILFCTLSDSILPYLGGRLLGVHMHFHMCFWSELKNVIPFLIVGLVNGWVLSRHHNSSQGLYSIFSHFLHIFISSLASAFYLIAHGLTDWYHMSGLICLFLIGAIVIPCTLSDVVVPMTVARRKNNARYQA